MGFARPRRTIENHLSFAFENGLDSSRQPSEARRRWRRMWGWRRCGSVKELAFNGDEVAHIVLDFVHGRLEAFGGRQMPFGERAPFDRAAMRKIGGGLIGISPVAHQAPAVPRLRPITRAD